MQKVQPVFHQALPNERYYTLSCSYRSSFDGGSQTFLWSFDFCLSGRCRSTELYMGLRPDISVFTAHRDKHGRGYVRVSRAKDTGHSAGDSIAHLVMGILWSVYLRRALSRRGTGRDRKSVV